MLARAARFCDQRLTVWVLPNDLPYTRLGLVVGRRHGSAVRRNRLKRVLREAFRLSRRELPAGLDVLCAPRPGVELELSVAMESLLGLVGRAAGGSAG